MTARLVSDSRSAELRRSLGPSAWCALECLVERSPDGRRTEASVRAIAADLGVAKNTAHRAIASLLRASLVEGVQRRDAAGRFLPGHYRLLVDGLVETVTATRTRPAAAKPTTDTTQLSLLAQ